MFTDIVGYTRLMGSDEEKAVDMLSRNRSIHQSCIEEFNGILIKEIGDGILASFSLASEAVRSAMEIQKECKEQGIPLKIGIHEGEMIFSGSDVIGDGVNIASRLQEDAQEGCINISAAVYSNIRNKPDIQAQLIGEKSFKNVNEPIKVFKVVLDAETPEPTNEQPSPFRNKTLYYIIAGLVVVIIGFLIWHFIPTIETNLRTPKATADEIDRSIAVLPFTDMSPSMDQEYFSDGMMDEILMHLYKIADLEVTSRTSVMQFRNTTKTIPQIASELGVMNILEGSVRKSENRVRITVQLIDAINDKHLWAESYDRELSDVFAIQSDVAKQIAKALKAEITPEMKERIEKIPTKSSKAYELYLESRIHVRKGSKEGMAIGTELLEKAIQIDPEFADAYAYLGAVMALGAGWDARDGGMNPQEAAVISKQFYNKALEIDKDNYVANLRLAWTYLWYEWDFEKAEEGYKKIIELRPNSTWTDFLISSGRFKEAYEEAKKVVEIDPLAVLGWSNKILSSYFFNKHDEALKSIEESLYVGMKYLNIYMETIRVYLYLKMYERVIETGEEFISDFPDLRPPRIIGTQAIAYYHIKQFEKANQILNELKQRSEVNAGGSPSMYIAMIYAQMGETDLAFEYLDKAYDAHEVEMYWLKVEPPFKPLHDDPRWQVMLDKVGFPDY